MASNGRYSQIEAPIKGVHPNTDQDLILITEDKLRLILEGHIKLVEEKKSWVAPLGIFIAIITTFVTSEFHEAFSFQAASWKAIFFISGCFSLYRLVVTGYKALNSPTVDTIVDKIKNRTNTP